MVFNVLTVTQGKPGLRSFICSFAVKLIFATAPALNATDSVIINSPRDFALH